MMQKRWVWKYKNSFSIFDMLQSIRGENGQDSEGLVLFAVVVSEPSNKWWAKRPQHKQEFTSKAFIAHLSWLACFLSDCQ